jgi:pyruvate formate lyase activating enzyme
VSQAGADDFPVAEVPPREVVHQALGLGVQGVAFTYTEPAVFFEYAADIAALARQAGLLVVAKSNGYVMPEVLAEMAGWLDAVNIDLKGWRDDRHREATGVAVGPVKDNLRLARRLGLWVEVCTLLAPGAADDPADLGHLARFLAEELGPDTPWHLLRFYPTYQVLDRPATPDALLQRAVDAGRAAGLRYIYTKDLHGGRMLHTVCPGCGTAVLERRAFGLSGSRLRGGGCGCCGRQVPGVGLGWLDDAGRGR